MGDSTTLVGRSTLVGQLVPFLLSRRYAPGERLPAERELAGRFKVSRGQIREALARLEALHVIERRAKSGGYMTGSQQTGVEALALFAGLGIALSAEDVRQALEIRRIHEVAAIRLACERRSEANLDRLRAILAAEAATLAAGEDAAHADRRFHREILQATQNGLFGRLAASVAGVAAAQDARQASDPVRARACHADHLHLFETIMRRDGDAAAAAMAAHLARTGEPRRQPAGRDAVAAD